MLIKRRYETQVSTNSDYQLVVTTVNSVMVERYIDFDMS
jgi:hypothetical protein